LLFNERRSLADLYIKKKLNLNECRYIINYIEKDLNEYIRIDNTEIFFKKSGDVERIYKYIYPLARENRYNENYWQFHMSNTIDMISIFK
jgi:hypothetical protein